MLTTRSIDTAKLSKEASLVQTTLDERTWASFKKLFARQKLGTVPFSSSIKVHCHIPVCIGYGKDIGSGELAAMIKNITSQGYDYTIYAAPRQKYPHEEEDPYEVWKKENAELLQSIDPAKIILEKDWRERPEWKKASDLYTAFRLDPEKNRIIEMLLTKDAAKYSRTRANIATDAITKHQLDCVIDCLSWMEPLSVKPNEPLSRINVLFYNHNLTQVMRNAFQNAEKIGYVLGSLTHLEPKYKDTLEHAPEPAPDFVLGPAPELSLTEQQLLQTVTSTLVTQKNTDPLYNAKVISMVYFELMARKLHHDSQSYTHPFAKKLAGENRDIYAGNGMFSGKPVKDVVAPVVAEDTAPTRKLSS